VQVLRCDAGGGRSCRLLLGLAELRDCDGERDKVADQDHGSHGRIAVGRTHERQRPRHDPQAAPGRGAVWNTAKGRPGCTVVRISRTLQRPILGDPGGGVECVGRRPCGVCRLPRIAPGT
jgi:hypothetical protein